MDTDDEPHKAWIPAAIEESFDGISKLAPIFQTNWIGAFLTLALIATTTASAATLIVVWRSPFLPQLQLQHDSHK